MSITYRPHRKKRVRTHGFLARKRTRSGQAVLKRRRQKGRHALSPASSSRHSA